MEIPPEALRILQQNNLLSLVEKELHNKGETSGELTLLKFITADPAMIEMKQRVRKLMNIPDPVLIHGETGTGKELIARALHGTRKGLFIPINCAGLPINLIESEIFGHTKGSFTGATGEKMGMMEAAKDGTLFLDEIGELPVEVQAKLLRAIQEKMIRKVGTNIELAINCRIIAATHRDLAVMMEKGAFREDLFYRISTFVINISPLRDRMGDVRLIVKHLDEGNKIGTRLDEFCNKIDITKLRGNVRALEQMVKRYHILEEMP